MRRLILLLSLCLFAAPAQAAVQSIRNAAELRAALPALKPGITLSLAPGEYGGGYFLQNVSGTPNAPIVIRAADPKNPPVFSKGANGWQLSDCNYLTLRGLVLRGCTDNGLNIDDGGSFQTPSRHIVIEDVTIQEIGPKGNHDGLKMSGVDDFTVRRCRFEGWGGSAIDMVGCHQGRIEECRFTGKEGFSQDSGVQMKGGTSNILVQTSLFHRAGQRAVNLGGSTGLQFFRPKPGKFEASQITVAGNRFYGGDCAIAWVSAEGGRVYRNTILYPEHWVLRVLQEQNAPGFQPCQGGVFEENLVVFDRRVTAFVNVGPKTAPETFQFLKNAWHQTDGNRRPDLPTPEKEGVYQVDPRLNPTTSPQARVTATDVRLKGIGAEQYQPRR